MHTGQSAGHAVPGGTAGAGAEVDRRDLRPHYGWHWCPTDEVGLSRRWGPQEGLAQGHTVVCCVFWRTGGCLRG